MFPSWWCCLNVWKDWKTLGHEPFWKKYFTGEKLWEFISTASFPVLCLSASCVWMKMWLISSLPCIIFVKIFQSECSLSLCNCKLKRSILSSKMLCDGMLSQQKKSTATGNGYSVLTHLCPHTYLVTFIGFHVLS